jgi:alpha-D-xyloside xylohydrolase
MRKNCGCSIILIFCLVVVAARRNPKSRSIPGPTLKAIPGGISWRGQYDTGQIEAYGRDSIRVRVGKQLHTDAPGSILATPEIDDADLGKFVVSCTDISGNITNGDIKAVIMSPTADADSDHTCCSSTGMVTIAFYRVSTGEEILSEYYPLHGRPARDIRPHARGSSLISASVSFNAYEGESFYGLGQHQHGKLDQKGLVIDLAQYNTEVAIPFMLSSRNYGFVWNVPSRGRVEMSVDKTRWYAEAAQQVDYMVIAGGSSFDVMERLVEATGHSPSLPEYATGYIQCKLRYASQAELLNVTREFKRRGLPLSMIVVDYLHWAHQGDWAFDNRSWPDPAAMVKEINGDGVEVMVSVWPTVEVASVNYPTMSANGMLVSTEAGGGSQGTMGITSSFHAYGSEVDAFNPAARDFMWSKLLANYVSYGIKSFWIDADEGGGDGEGDGGAGPDEVYMLGSQPAVGLMYPLYQQRAIYDGLTNLTDTATSTTSSSSSGGSSGSSAMAAPMPGFTLSRSAWLGSQRYGGALWSGDTESTFESLQLQLRAGLNAQMSGIAWWTTDIGGFMLGRNQITDPYFRELLVRWFQFALTCPLFRMHGDRWGAVRSSEEQ